MNKPKCKICHKKMSYNTTTKKWECHHPECWIQKLSNQKLMSTEFGGIVVGIPDNFFCFKASCKTLKCLPIQML